jgi:uncharacterized protein (DUF169 family)
MALCQGITLARTLGWVLTFREEDHRCPFAKVFLGHSEPDRFLEAEAADFYQEDPDVARAMEASVPRRKVGEVFETWIAPLSRCEFEPHLALVYGTPAQMTLLVQAANFGKGTGIRSSSMGRCGCAVWIAGVPAGGECAYLLPGSGERVFGGAQDHEMAFIIPRPQFGNIAEGLEYIRKKGAYRYPVPNMMLLAEPRFPPKYDDIEK